MGVAFGVGTGVGAGVGFGVGFAVGFGVAGAGLSLVDIAFVGAFGLLSALYLTFPDHIDVCEMEHRSSDRAPVAADSSARRKL